MHWADVVASRLGEKGEKHRIATGITPSGHIHVGNMREILTGDLVFRASHDAGLEVELCYNADDFDPLRKVYPFLPESYGRYVGMPISQIPSPGNDGTTYAEHFLKPFLDSIELLGIHPRVIRSSEAYRDGKYASAISMVMEQKERVKEILERISGRDLSGDWIPYNPKCSSCQRFDTTDPISWEKPYVHYTCACGNEGKADTRTDDGKLPWRVDWPARWYWIGVTCEPYGKDHAAAGGSYDTSSAIVREIFDMEPPEPVVYEWIQLKGKGAMSSSTGVVISAVDMLRTIPPEVLRFLISRNHPNRHIDIDMGLGILGLVDDFDRYEIAYHTEESRGEEQLDRRRAFQLSMVDADHPAIEKDIVQVPYRHLVTLAQLVDDREGLLERIKRTEGIEHLPGESVDRVIQRLECVRYWLDNSAPEGVRFTLYDEPPKEVVESLTDEERNSLKAMGREFENCPWEAESIHNAVYEGSRSRDIDPRVTFRAFYRILLGRERGPKLGFFLSTMDKKDVLRRIKEALG